MSVNKKIPEIRFKGFSGEWKEKKLGTDVAEIVGGGTPSTSISVFWDGDIDWYSPTEIGGDVYADSSQKKITALGLKSSSAKILPAGNTVLFTSRAGIGDMAILTKPGTTNQGFQSFVVKEGFSPYFLYSAGKLIKKYALKHASGSTFLEISGKQLGNMEILTPSTKEQTAIGNCFQKLDSLIKQHQQKHDKLCNIKKALLEKMFPKQGETIPEIRFKGFSGEWEEKPLKKVASDITDGNWIESEHIFESGEFRIIQTGNIGIGQYLDRPKHAKFFHQLNFNAVRGNEIYHGDILISRLAEPAGRAALLPDTGYRMVTAVDVAIVRSESGFDSYFLMTLLNMEQTLKAIAEWVSGTSHKRISHANLVKVEIIVPCVEEQTAIGNTFQKLDSLITQHQQQITQLKNIKQALLSKMFV